MMKAKGRVGALAFFGCFCGGLFLVELAEEGGDGGFELGVAAEGFVSGVVGDFYVGFELLVLEEGAVGEVVADDGDAEVEGAVLISSIRRIFDYRIKN